MSFLRHARSIGPMWVLTSRKAQPGCRLPLVGTANRHKGATEIAPLLIVRDESHRLSLGGLLSSRARLRFAGCVQSAMKEYGRSRNFQRTANSVLTVCVSSGDKRNPTARLLLHILASVAEFESELIRERVRAGIKSAKHKGKQLGRKRVVFDRGKAAEMYERGATVREIAAAMKIGRGTVQRFLAQKPTASGVQ